MLDAESITNRAKDYVQSKGFWYARKLFNLYDSYDTLRHRNRLEATFKAIERNFHSLKSVALVGSADPINLVCSLKNRYDCRVELIGDHALTELCREFYESELVDRVTLLNPFFESIDYTEYDLVLVPDFEFFVPLSLLKRSNLRGVKFLCVHYMQHVLKHNSVLDVYSVEDMIEQCGFNTVIDCGRETNVDGRQILWALGVT